MANLGFDMPDSYEMINYQPWFIFIIVNNQDIFLGLFWPDYASCSSRYAFLFKRHSIQQAAEKSDYRVAGPNIQVC